MKKIHSKKIVIAMIAVLCIMSFISGCGKSKGKEDEMLSTESQAKPTTKDATDRTKGWFISNVERHTNETLGISESKVFGSVYEIREGISSDNAMNYASADIDIFVKLEDVTDTTKAADFSDGFARKLGSDGAAGNIKCYVHVVPESIYEQIEEGNYNQIEEKSKDIEGYARFGFDYSGIGDAIYTMSGNQSTEVTASGTDEAVSTEPTEPTQPMEPSPSEGDLQNNNDTDSE